METTERILHHHSPHRICHLAADQAAAEILELEDRVIDLESDCKTYKMLACAALESVAALTERNKVLAKRIDNLTGQLRELMGCAGESRTTHAREEAQRTIAAMRRRQVKDTTLHLASHKEPSWTM
jgi:hypothetical protein